MDKNFTIPVNEAFEASAANPACGCPFCALYRMLEENELDLILGASMMSRISASAPTGRAFADCITI